MYPSCAWLPAEWYVPYPVESGTTQWRLIAPPKHHKPIQSVYKHSIQLSITTNLCSHKRVRHQDDDDDFDGKFDLCHQQHATAQYPLHEPVANSIRQAPCRQSSRQSVVRWFHTIQLTFDFDWWIPSDRVQSKSIHQLLPEFPLFTQLDHVAWAVRDLQWKW